MPLPATTQTLRLDLAAAMDDRGVVAAPATAMIRLEPGWEALAFPTLDAAVARGPIPPARGAFSVRIVHTPDAPTSPTDAHIRLPDCVLLPGLVNAHTHLDLTDIGPYDAGRGDFPAFIERVRSLRPAEDAAIEAAVRRGVDLSLLRGVVAVGDIAGCPRSGPTEVPFRTLAGSPLTGVSFLEYFAIGPRAGAAAARAITLARTWAAASTAGSAAGVRLGLQPHAPYSVGPTGYQAAAALAAELGLPVATHLAESPAERRFIEHGDGPQRSFLESLGLWDAATAADFGRGRSPIEHLRAAWPETRRLLAVHCNDARTDRDLDALASLASAVAYCPRSSTYFDSERHFGPHRFDEMLARGIPVCLGTDSIINVPSAEADPGRSGGLSVFDEARVLRATRRQSAAPLLAMLTTHGARGLGLPIEEFRFGELGAETAPRGLALVRGVDPAAPEETLFAPGTTPYLLLLRNFYR